MDTKGMDTKGGHQIESPPDSGGLLWALLGTIQRPSDYESDALTN